MVMGVAAIYDAAAMVPGIKLVGERSEVGVGGIVLLFRDEATDGGREVMDGADAAEVPVAVVACCAAFAGPIISEPFDITVTA